MRLRLLLLILNTVMIYPEEFKWLENKQEHHDAPRNKLVYGLCDEERLMVNKANAAMPVYWYNQEGYRDQPGVHQINFERWHESIVVLGDSFAFGQGLSWEHSFCGHLEARTKKKVICLGKPASSNVWIWDRATRMMEGRAPCAVVCVWSEFTRTYTWGENEHLMWGDGGHRDHALLKYLVLNPFYAQQFSYMLFRSVKQQLQLVPQAHVTWNPGMQGLVTLVPKTDVAVDGGHWGPQSAAAAADLACEQLSVFL